MSFFKKAPKPATPKAGGQSVTEQLAGLGIQVKQLPPLSSTAVSSSIGELRARFNRESQILAKNPQTTRLNTVDLRFLAYGLDFIDFAKQGFNVELTLAEPDIELVEQIAEQAHRAYVSHELTKDNVEKLAKDFVGYIGLLIGIHKGGVWVAGDVDNPHIDDCDGSAWYVYAKVWARIQRGGEDNLVTYYREIPYPPARA
jgi:hypothetical protein